VGIEEIRANFNSQFNQNGTQAFGGLFSQIPTNSDNSFIQWLINLQVFSNME
jgi:hypothetical protein